MPAHRAGEWGIILAGVLDPGGFVLTSRRVTGS
jgi:hypothetical protein